MSKSSITPLVLILKGNKIQPMDGSDRIVVIREILAEMAAEKRADNSKSERSLNLQRSV